MIGLHRYPIDRLPIAPDMKGVLPLASQFAPQAIARNVKLLEEAAAKTHLQPSKLFGRALTMWETMMQPPWEVSADHWLNEVCAGLERGIGLLREIYIELLWQAMHNYEDILGGIYSAVCVGRQRSGQFFTPMHIARVVADIDVSGLEPRSPGEQPYTILDPACGSGVMLLAAAEYSELHYPAMLDHDLLHWVGYDIDPICVQMTNINMKMHRAGRISRHLLEIGLALEPGISIAEAEIRTIKAFEKQEEGICRLLSQYEQAIMCKVLSTRSWRQSTENRSHPAESGETSEGPARTGPHLFVFDDASPARAYTERGYK